MWGNELHILHKNSKHQFSRGKCSLFFLMFFSFLFYADVWAQQSYQNKSGTVYAGIFFGKGSQVLDFKSYNYNLITCQGTIEYYVYSRRFFNITLLGLPQINKTKFQQNSGDEQHQGYEMGINLGILFKIQLQNKYHLYSGFGSGPHYITETPQVQASGFIFSDNLYLGMSCNIYKALDINFMYQFRHVSNAGLKNPNQGINNTIFSWGVNLKILDPKYSFENSKKS
ncbi:MAG: hypothetical protein RIR48_1754 [Bacteroidota bacterium]